MRHSIQNSLNKKNQNGSKNPFPTAKEFTPNGAVWGGYETTNLGIYEVDLVFTD